MTNEEKIEALMLRINKLENDLFDAKIQIMRLNALIDILK